MKKESIGERVKRLRLALGWNQETLARRANLGRSTISKIEAGDRAPETRTVNYLAEALEETPNMIRFGKDALPSLAEVAQHILDAFAWKMLLGSSVTGIVAPDGSPGPGRKDRNAQAQLFGKPEGEEEQRYMCIKCGLPKEGNGPGFCLKCLREDESGFREKKERAFFPCHHLKCITPFVSTDTGICEKCGGKEEERKSSEKRKIPPFREGDIVRLKSGGPKMTVVLAFVEEGEYECLWFTGGNKQISQRFREGMLVFYEDEQEKEEAQKTNPIADLLEEERERTLLLSLPKMEKADLRAGLFALLYQIMTDDPDAECRRMAIEGAIRIAMEREEK